MAIKIGVSKISEKVVPGTLQLFLLSQSSSFFRVDTTPELQLVLIRNRTFKIIFKNRTGIKYGNS